MKTRSSKMIRHAKIGTIPEKGLATLKNAS